MGLQVQVHLTYKEFPNVTQLGFQSFFFCVIKVESDS
jgi:hypothetical protein